MNFLLYKPRIMTKNLITYSYKIDVLCVFATLFQLENPLSVPFLDGFGGSRVQLAAKINMNILVYVNQIVLTSKIVLLAQDRF